MVLTRVVSGVLRMKGFQAILAVVAAGLIAGTLVSDPAWARAPGADPPQQVTAAPTSPDHGPTKGLGANAIRAFKGSGGDHASASGGEKEGGTGRGILGEFWYNF